MSSIQLKSTFSSSRFECRNQLWRVPSAGPSPQQHHNVTQSAGGDVEQFISFRQKQKCARVNKSLWIRSELLLEVLLLFSMYNFKKLSFISTGQLCTFSVHRITFLFTSKNPKSCARCRSLVLTLWRTEHQNVFIKVTESVQDSLVSLKSNVFNDTHLRPASATLSAVLIVMECVFVVRGDVSN